MVALFVIAAIFSIVVYKVRDEKAPRKSLGWAIPGALLVLAAAAGSSFYNVTSIYGFVTGENLEFTFLTVLLLILHTVLFMATTILTVSALRTFLIPSFKKQGKPVDKSNKAVENKPEETPALNKPVETTTDDELDQDIEAQLNAMRNL